MTPKESEAVAALITACDSREFGNRLDDLSRLLASFDMSCAFAYRYDHTPEVIHDGYSTAVSRDALSRYLKGGYLLDPFYVACVSGVKEGLWRMRDIAPDGFFASDFASSREVHPCISEEEGTLVEEIGFITPLGDGASAVYSLMRNKGGSPFSSAEFQGLQGVSPIIAASMRRHLGASRASQSAAPSATDSESAFRLAFGDRLTPTQHTVVRLILRGHSNVSIASHMQITEGTQRSCTATISTSASTSVASQNSSSCLSNIWGKKSISAPIAAMPQRWTEPRGHAETWPAKFLS